MITRCLQSRSRLWWLFAAVWLGLTAGVRPLMLPDEGRYVGVAWEMLANHQWLVPTLDGMPFFHKPPLFYWLTMIGLQVFGMHEWAARLASWSSAWMVALGMVMFLRKHASVTLSNVSMVLLLSTPFFFIGAQFANLDMLVASMISLTILCGADAVLSLEQGLAYRRSLSMAYVFAALGLLAKGLIGVALPGAVLLVWMLMRKQYRSMVRMFAWPQIVLFAALALPWFVWMQHLYGGFWDYFFVYHHFKRFAQAGFNNQQPFWFYVPVLLVLVLPWSAALWRACKPEFYKQAEGRHVRSLMLVWLLVILVFFSIPKSKLIGYILPALVPFAVLLASGLHEGLTGPRAARRLRHIAWTAAGAATLCVGLVVFLSFRGHSDIHGMRADLRQRFEPHDQLIMLDRYAYDLPFYLHAQKPAWVVSDWQSPQIPSTDNWQKELYDAGLFEPAVMQRNLISTRTLTQRLCIVPKQNLWVWGPDQADQQRPWLKPEDQMHSTAGHHLWLITPQRWPALKPLMGCGEMPSNG